MNVFQLHVRPGKDRLGEAAFLLEQRQKKMLDVDLLVPAPAARDWAERKAFLKFFRKAVKIHNVPSS